jgi:hypothetical protein
VRIGNQHSEDLSHKQVYGEVRLVNPFIRLGNSSGFHEKDQLRYDVQ